MPDVVIFARPDVTINAAVPATVSHPRLASFSNAVQVAAEATDLGRVNITVGLAVNANVTIGTTTTVAGVGNTTTVRAGDAVGAGPSAGGNVIIQPGNGIGGGADGQVVPDVTDTVTLGTAALQFGGIQTSYVGYNNGALAVFPTRSLAGVGDDLQLYGGAAFGAGPSVGGDVMIGAGLGVGGGLQGDVIFDDQGAALTVRPTTTNVVSLGATLLAFNTGYMRNVRADTGQNLNLIREDTGVSQISIRSANTWAVNATGTVFADWQTVDNISYRWGTSNDSGIRWSTASANNVLMCWTGVNSAAQSGNIILTTAANVSNEHGLAAVLTPRLAIFSAADMSVAENRTQYVQMYHDGTNGRLTTGSGSIIIGPVLSAIDTATFTQSIAGGTAVTLRQGVSTSGSPTLLSVIGNSHTTLAASTEAIDVKFNLARTVQFATGALALQRAVLFQAPTYGFVGASTITDAYTVYVDGAPIAGTNATITRGHALGLGGRLTCVTSVDSVAVADQVSLSRYEIGAGQTVLAVSQELAVAVDIGLASTHSWQVRINGATYKVLLVAV